MTKEKVLEEIAAWEKELEKYPVVKGLRLTPNGKPSIEASRIQNQIQRLKTSLVFEDRMRRVAKQMAQLS